MYWNRHIIQYNYDSERNEHTEVLNEAEENNDGWPKLPSERKVSLA